jgi:ABC-2 type transport system ATP-binding protein
MAPAIVVNDLTKHYGNVVAVDHISFQINEGEIFGFLGPNGAGKTTTIRMLMNLTPPTAGTAEVLGMDSAKDSLAVKAVVGIVPEVSNIFPELTVQANLTFTGALYGLSRRDRTRRADELMGIFDLEEHRDKKGDKLSLGLRRRLTLAMSIMHRPRVVFLDEPSSGLDVVSARDIRDIIMNMKKEGVTFFLTTHNMDEANQLCQRIAVVNQGRIIAVDTPDRLKQAATEVQAVEVVFDRALDPSEVSELSRQECCGELRQGEDSYRILTEDPSLVLGAIYPFMEKHNLKPLSINTFGPSLEDVFIKLTHKEKGAADDE